MRVFAFDIDDYPEGTLVRDPRPLRLFVSDRVERLTHVTPRSVAAIFGTLVLVLTGAGLAAWPADRPRVGFAFLFVVGAALVWTFIEYALHRFLFHLRPRYRWQAQLVFLLHGIHHVQPQLPTRLVMPAVVSLPLTLVFAWLFQAVAAAPASTPPAPPLPGCREGFRHHQRLVG